MTHLSSPVEQQEKKKNGGIYSVNEKSQTHHEALGPKAPYLDYAASGANFKHKLILRICNI